MTEGPAPHFDPDGATSLALCQRPIVCGEEIENGSSKAIKCHYKSVTEELYWLVCFSAYADVLCELEQGVGATLEPLPWPSKHKELAPDKAPAPSLPSTVFIDLRINSLMKTGEPPSWKLFTRGNRLWSFDKRSLMRVNLFAEEEEEEEEVEGGGGAAVAPLPYFPPFTSQLFLLGRLEGESVWREFQPRLVCHHRAAKEWLHSGLLSSLRVCTNWDRTASRALDFTDPRVPHTGSSQQLVTAGGPCTELSSEFLAGIDECELQCMAAPAERSRRLYLYRWVGSSEAESGSSVYTRLPLYQPQYGSSGP
ncbi:unnamed protein product [Pleuronectes platessa]|uniref:Uncharacterized protein n=1 Tax=Pleuronectes platessa TaxID=8262 RepID=A0A9N7YWY7_PLEPL|nr:unnamed protein product [Pleuronectes platessa]